MRVSVIVAMAMLSAMLVAAAPSTLRLQKKHPNQLYSNEELSQGIKPTHIPAAVYSRRSIPMNGGIFTVGAYFAEVSAGTGAGKATFDAIVDTGSSNTAVPAVGCPTCQTPAPLYNITASPTGSYLGCGTDFCQNCIPVNIGSNTLPPGSNTTGCHYGTPSCETATGSCEFAISYGGSSSALQGVIGQDVVCLGNGGLCGNAFVDLIRNEYPTGTISTGIIGVAYPANACNPSCQPTLLDSFVADGVLQPQENMFGMCITTTQGGAIDLGYVNSSRFYGDLVYTPIVSAQWYNIEVRDIAMDGVSIGVPSIFYKISNDGIGAFVDSGTGVVLVSPYTFQVMQQIVATRYTQFPLLNQLFNGLCPAVNASQKAAFPVFSFVLAGMPEQPDVTVRMNAEDYLLPAGNGTFCLGISGVASIGLILGDVIMAKYYIVFDRAGGRLGFAPLKDCN